jgi:hypothetical protein
MINNNSKNNLCKYMIYTIVCIVSVVSVCLLVAALILGEERGKSDQLVVNLFISFAFIYGSLVIFSIFGLLCGICIKSLR